jgi:hypothetical protein
LRAANPGALIMDAMGELRTIYEPPLVREILASGIDSITVTLCDPKAEGAEALELAVDGLMEYDSYLTAHPDLFVKATSVGHIDEARDSGRMAVFYLYQNATQFGDDLDRVEMFHRLGLTSCQVTYNERNLAGVGCRAAGDEGGTVMAARSTAASPRASVCRSCSFQRCDRPLAKKRWWRETISSAGEATLSMSSRMAKLVG